MPATKRTRAQHMRAHHGILIKCLSCCVCVLQEVLGNCNIQPTTAAGPRIPQDRAQSPFRFGFDGFDDIQARIDQIFKDIQGRSSGRKLLRDQPVSSRRMN